jgi:hypothetical protein
MAKRIPVLSEESDYGLDRSLAGSLGLRGAAEYERQFLVPINAPCDGDKPPLNKRAGS